MQEFFVYAMISLVDGRIYVGISRDPINRLKEHNSEKTSSTKAYIPWNLFYREFCGNAKQAREREKYFKSAAGKRRLRAILKDSMQNFPGSLPD
jgi:putative endonuclease